MKYKCLYGGVVFTRPAPLRRRLPPRSVVTPPMFRGYTPPPMEGVTTEQGEIPPRAPPTLPTVPPALPTGRRGKTRSGGRLLYL